MSTLMMLMPPEYAVFLFVAAGLAFICQAKRLGASLMIGGVAMILLPPLIEPFLPFVPTWILLLLVVGFILSLGRASLNMCVGRAAGDHAVGALAADVIRFLFLLPFRVAGGLLAVLFRRGAP